MRLSLHPPAAVVTDPGTATGPRPRAGRAGAELRQVITTRIAETRYPPFGAVARLLTITAESVQICLICAGI